VPLSEKGKVEAVACGKELAAQGYTFDLAYTSLLKRAVSEKVHDLKLCARVHVLLL
jgi:2,3-bisphosphoglycerate-dependent phosphoglycerate mutase